MGEPSPHYYKEVPGPGKTLRVGAVDKEELGSAASRGSLPLPPASPLYTGNKEPFEHRDRPSSCLMPAH